MVVIDKPPIIATTPQWNQLFKCDEPPRPNQPPLNDPAMLSAHDAPQHRSLLKLPERSVGMSYVTKVCFYRRTFFSKFQIFFSRIFLYCISRFSIFFFPNIGMRSVPNIVPYLLNFQTLEMFPVFPVFPVFLFFLFFLGKRKRKIWKTVVREERP